MKCGFQVGIHCIVGSLSFFENPSDFSSSSQWNHHYTACEKLYLVWYIEMLLNAIFASNWISKRDIIKHFSFYHIISTIILMIGPSSWMLSQHQVVKNEKSLNVFWFYLHTAPVFLYLLHIFLESECLAFYNGLKNYKHLKFKYLRPILKLKWFLWHPDTTSDKNI